MSSLLQQRANSAFAVVWLCDALLLIGCSPKGWYATPITFDPAVISVQPLNQIVAPGQTATFTVAANSDLPLTYQWTENGAPIPDATGPSYTTPPAVSPMGGSTLIGTFAVVIKNSSTFTTSQPATLTIGPRPPKSGDLRYLLYQQVVPIEVTTQDALFDSIQYGPYGGTSFSANNALGTPLSMGSSYLCQGECVWFGYAQFLSFPVGFNPVGYSMYYQPGGYSSFSLDMQSLAAPNVVLTSLDMEPAMAAYAVSWVQTGQPGGFDYRLDPVIPAGTGQQSGIQTQAILDGIESRVITAVSFDASGNANLISYGWQGDTTTMYEAQAILVSPGSGVVTAVGNAASALANDGYFISAFGGNDTNGYLLIGMRVQGDSYPRPIEVGMAPATNPTWANYTMVVDLCEGPGHLFVYEQ